MARGEAMKYGSHVGAVYFNLGISAIISPISAKPWGEEKKKRRKRKKKGPANKL